ncbi:proprotein convertase P-domain-containing protein [Lentzea sp. NPDC092896]|uniref:proprotein convertase P-domain-containing protein n=1 Tax=Lentzea sp. NPDC092896 TaxID=3364127 RepID=UPI0037FFE120
MLQLLERADCPYEAIGKEAQYCGVTPPGPGKFFENAADFQIGDNTTINSPITVSEVTGNAPSTLKVAVDIKHTYQGDLKVDLVAPDGTVYVLHNRAGGGTDNINTTYTVNASSEVANGTWQLRVNDNANQDTGFLDKWSLQF